MNEDASSEYIANRSRGRPSLKWDSVVNGFCDMHFNNSWQNSSIDDLGKSHDRFVQFFCGNRNEYVPVIIPSSEIVANVRIARSASFVPFFQPSTNTWW